MRDRTGRPAGTAIASCVFACAVIAAVAPGCKGGRKAAKGAASGPGAAGAHIMVESGAPDRDCIYDVIVEETDDSKLADSVFERLGARFRPPAVLVSLDEAKATSDLLEAMHGAGCDVGKASVVNGQIEWKLEVLDQGNGSDCMVNALRDIFPGTTAADWSGKVGLGQVLQSSRNSGEVEILRSSLEKKCGCRIRKTYAVD